MTAGVLHVLHVLFGRVWGISLGKIGIFLERAANVLFNPFLAWNRTVEDGQRDLVDPAVKGTKNVLSAVAKSLDTVKRVVLTSSFAGAHKHVFTTREKAL